MRALLAAVFIIAIIGLVAGLAMNLGPVDVSAETGRGEVVVPVDGSGGGVDLVVDRSGDEGGLACTTAANDCTLRSAIENANRDGRESVITFSEHHFIELTAQLPALTEPGTTISAKGMEVHLNGRGVANTILRVTTHNVVIDGLRIYGANAQNPNLVIGGAAYNVRIVNNLIGDDDKPAQRCGASEEAYAGIYVDANGPLPEGVAGRAYIVGNIIECHGGTPGDGIIIATSGVFVGEDTGGRADATTRNIIRNNSGTAVVVQQGGNTVRGNEMRDNGGDIRTETFDGNIFAGNDIN